MNLGRDGGWRSAYLWKANLTGADLSGAYVTATNLTGANLSNANLTDANLSFAILRGVNLTGANMSQVWLSWSRKQQKAFWDIVNSSTICPNGKPWGIGGGGNCPF